MTCHSSSGIRRVSGLLIPLLALLGSTAIGKNYETDSRWAESQIHIDGRSGDWKSVQGVFLSEQNAAFTINNDGEFLYVLFRTTDQGWARAIKMTGLTLYFDVAGGKKKDASVCFKGGPSMEQAMALRPRNAGAASDMPTPPGGGQGPRGMEDSRPPSLTCNIEDRIKDMAVPLDGSAGPAAAFDTCQGFFTYEFRVPLAAGGDDYYGLGVKPGQAISVGGVWGDMGETASQGARGGGMGEPPSGGGMGGPGGGMGGPGGGMGGPGGGMGGPGGGMGGPGGGERPKMPTKQEVWIKATMSAPQAPATGETK